MSKIDSLLAMVDTISARSDKLVNTLNESNSLISLIMESNTTISKYDTEIDTMSQLVSKNNTFLAEFQKLYEKSFFLESNFGLNDCYTNDTSFSNLYNEYDFLWNEFHGANTKLSFQRTGQVHVPDSPEVLEKRVSPERKVKNTISISNLNLKPLRCKDSKVQKQKSRYRLSEAYTLNPLLALPIREVLETSTTTQYSNLMEALDQDNGTDTSFFSESSVPALPISVKNQNHEDDLSRTPPFLDVEHKTNLDSFDPSSLPLLFKSLYTLAYETGEVDDLGSLDFEPQSPDSRFEDFDNFHHFLRRSRINLKETFPPPLERARSHDSVLSVIKLEPSAPVSTSVVKRKFNNPAAMINALKKSLSTQPTVEAIYSRGIDASSKFKEHSTKLLATQGDKTPRQDDKESTPKKPPSFDLFKLMNSPLGSPRGFKRLQTPDPKQPVSSSISIPNCDIPHRRKSVDIFGKSLASSFLNLVNTSSSLPKQTRFVLPDESSHGATTTSPPEKIKKLKKDLKNPIALMNDIKSKRLPPLDRLLKNGSSSCLTIGPNKTKIINHGESSAFKKPTLRRMSQSLLTDALNESLLY